MAENTKSQHTPWIQRKWSQLVQNHRDRPSRWMRLRFQLPTSQSASLPAHTPVGSTLNASNSANETQVIGTANNASSLQHSTLWSLPDHLNNALLTVPPPVPVAFQPSAALPQQPASDRTGVFQEPPPHYTEQPTHVDTLSIVTGPSTAFLSLAPSTSTTTHSSADPHRALNDTYASSYPCCNRKALLIGIDYVGQTLYRPGGTQGVLEMNFFLQHHKRQDTDTTPWETRLLLDTMSDPRALPTKENIAIGLRWLIKDVQVGDKLVLYFAGWGGQVQAMSQLPSMGSAFHYPQWTEVILPVNASNGHILTAYELHDLVVKDLPAGVKLYAVFESIHVGSILNLAKSYSCAPDPDRLFTHYSDNLEPWVEVSLRNDMAANHLDYFVVDHCKRYLPKIQGDVYLFAPAPRIAQPWSSLAAIRPGTMARCFAKAVQDEDALQQTKRVLKGQRAQERVPIFRVLARMHTNPEIVSGWCAMKLTSSRTLRSSSHLSL